MVCLGVRHVFQGCLPQILLGPLLSTFNQMMFYLFVIQGNSHVQLVNQQIDDEDSLYEFDDDFYKEDRQDLPFVSYTEVVPENQIAMAEKHSNEENVFRANDQQTKAFKQQPSRQCTSPENHSVQDVIQADFLE